MLLQIPGVLTAQELAQSQRLLEAAEWIDGRVTAGHQSAQVKHNRQLAESSQAAHELGKLVVGAVVPQSVVHLRGTAEPDFSAALQLLRGRRRLRHARG